MKHRFFRIGERVFNCDYKHSDNFDFGVISNINGKPESQVINEDDSKELEKVFNDESVDDQDYIEKFYDMVYKRVRELGLVS